MFEKEAEELVKNLDDCHTKEMIRDAFKDGAEFGERESEEKIAELELQLEREKNLNQCLSDNNEQLREQIKRMKCCYNCEHGQNECYCSIKHSDICDLSCWDCGCDKWEIKENG